MDSTLNSNSNLIAAKQIQGVVGAIKLDVPKDSTLTFIKVNPAGSLYALLVSYNGVEFQCDWTDVSSLNSLEVTR